MGEYPSTPTWVKYLFIGTLVLLAIGIVVTLVTGVDHGPGRH